MATANLTLLLGQCQHTSATRWHEIWPLLQSQHSLLRFIVGNSYHDVADTDDESSAELLYTKHESEQNLTIVKGGALIPIIVLAQTTFQVLQIASNYWMASACPTTGGTELITGMNIILLVYTLLAVGSSLCVLVRAMLVAVAGIMTSQKLFTNMLRSVLLAPMSFFDSTPTGRILNRASTDQSVVDLEMANRLGWCAFSIIQLLGTIAVMSQVAWEVFAIFIPVTAINCKRTGPLIRDTTSSNPPPLWRITIRSSNNPRF